MVLSKVLTPLIVLLLATQNSWAACTTEYTKSCPDATSACTAKAIYVCDTPEEVQAPTGIPSGVVVMVISGACPTGYTEVASMADKTVIGTMNISGDVGTTGGIDTITGSVNHLHNYCSQTATTGGAASYEHGAIDTSSAKTECSQSTENPTGGVTSIDNRSSHINVIFCSKD